MELFWTFALAGFAGFVNYIQRFAGKADERPPWEWGPCAIKVFTGSFVGLLTVWLIGTRIEDKGYVNFAIAIAGYGGPLTLDFFLQLFRDALSRAAQGAQDRGPKN